MPGHCRGTAARLSNQSRCAGRPKRCPHTSRVHRRRRRCRRRRRRRRLRRRRRCWPGRRWRRAGSCRRRRRRRRCRRRRRRRRLRVAVGVGLVGVGDQRAVVGAVGDAVVVVVGVAGVALAVAVGVRPGRRWRRAAQLSAPSATPSLSSSASQASPGASPSVSAWSGFDACAAVVGAVGDAVVVVVGVAGVALAVAVGVRPGPGSRRAGSCRRRRRRRRCRRRRRRRRPGASPSLLAWSALATVGQLSLSIRPSPSGSMNVPQGIVSARRACPAVSLSSVQMNSFLPATQEDSRSDRDALVEEVGHRGRARNWR